jgi:peptide/nickel transport system ATP-binding protein
MYGGYIVEYADSTELYKNPIHPYTQGLLRSIPNIELADQKLSAIPGSPPNMLNPPKGCRFWPRCENTKIICKSKEPSLVNVGNNHFVRCFSPPEEGAKDIE